MFHKLGAIIVLCAVSAPALADPNGLWRAKDGAKVHVGACGHGLCGTITATAPRLDPESGKPWTDKHNPDPGKRNRPLVGVQIFSAAPNGAKRWSGRLYNVDDGRTYSGNVIEVDARTIRVEGCVLGLCGGENMTRLE
jgi:uncharacterized protein (DUF2147 family)